MAEQPLASAAAQRTHRLALLALLLLLTACLHDPAIVIAREAGSAEDDPGRAALRAHCLACHGPSKRKGGLDLSRRATALAGGKSGEAIMPGKPAYSLLFEKVTAGEMPPSPRKALSKDEVAAIRRWIEAGAPYDNEPLAAVDRPGDGPLWSLQPLTKTEVPTVRKIEWVRTPVDAFILIALEGKGLAPSPEADRRTLIRRLTFDLHGLPPTPSEIDAFAQDRSPTAYEKVVDRLLASPRYGERWGRHWLDVAHYGDTHGYDKDKRRDHAWPYRDYVIRSFNADKPYARFVEEQVAGDVLFPGDPDGVIATGFIAAGPWDLVGQVELREGTVDKEKTRLLDRDDMLASTISTFQSLTVHCARCHDHKFDPIPQVDYYRLQAVFAGVDRGDRPIPSPQADRRKADLAERRVEIAGRLAALKARAKALTGPELARLDERRNELLQRLANLAPPAPTAASPSNGYHSAIHPSADAPSWVQVDLGSVVPIDEIRLVPARPVDFPDTPGFGFPVRFRVELANSPGFEHARAVDERDRSDFEGQGDEPYIVRPGGREARYVRVTATRLWKRTNDYVFALGELEVLSQGKNVALHSRVATLDSIEGGLWGAKALVDGFDSRGRRPDVSDRDSSARVDLLFQVQQVERERKAASDRLVPSTLRDELAATAAELAAIDATVKGLSAGDPVYAVLSHEARPIRLLRRGEVEQPEKPVGPGALSCVAGLEFDFAKRKDDGEGSRRAALAAWIVDRKNVLTWRSIVNRLWHYHFGRGIVETPNDFGRNGAEPSHPELLDWMATEFLRQGQSIKAMHRLFVTSAVYRQSSKHDPAAAKVDGDNRWLWRMNRRRLDAESIRDSVLAVSGELDLRMGGPGFELFRFKDDHSPIYDHTARDRINSPEGRRRSVYRFVVRSVPNPFMECLDAADPNANTPVRNTTITPLQALALLNDPFMIRQASAFAGRVERLDPASSGRIDAAFRLAFGRLPGAEERAALMAHAREHGLAAACRLLLNANEFVFVD